MNNGPQSFLSTAVAPVPFAWRTPQETYKGVSGPCDTSGKFMRTQLQEVRYGVQLWTFAVAAPGAPGIVAAGTQRRTFAEGIGDVGVNLGWGTPPLSQQQTNAYPNGSLNNAKEGAFVARSIAFTAQRAFLYDAATGTRLYSDLVDQYGARAARALLEALEFSMLQRDNNVSLNIGPPYLWPSPQQVVEDTYPTTDKANGPAVMLPLNRDYVFIDDNQGSQNFLVGLAATPIVIDSDPAAQLPATFSVPIFTAVYGDVMSVGEACDVVVGAGASAEIDKLMAKGLTAAQAYDVVMKR